MKLFLCQHCGAITDFNNAVRNDPTCPRCDVSHMCRELTIKEIESVFRRMRTIGHTGRTKTPAYLR